MKLVYAVGERAITDHHHHHHHPDQSDISLLKKSFFLIAGFMVIELVAGLMTNALVLIADAGHMFLDAAALGLAWWSAAMSQKGDDAKLSYGYHRMQVLAAFINGLTLVALAIWITAESFLRLASPEPILPLPTLAVGLIGLAINFIAYRWLHGSHDNLNVKSAALHVLGDLLGSVAAVLASLAVLFFGWLYIDPILTLLIAFILFRGAFGVLKDSVMILLEGVPPGVDINEIKTKLIENCLPVVDVHHVHAWSLTSNRPMVTLHAQINDNDQAAIAIESIKAVLKHEFRVDHSTIQIELEKCPDNEGTHDHA